MIKKLSFLAIAALIAAASCTKVVEPEIENEDPNLIRINAIHPSAQTKVNFAGFESGDEIGVYVTAQGSLLQSFGNSVNNGRFVYDGAKWTPSKAYYWNEGEHDVYAYYPYIEEINDTEEITFKVQLDQSTPEGYGSSDFLWAKTSGAQAGTDPVTLTFGHIFSRAVVEIAKGEKYEGDIPDNAEVYIHNTVTTAAIDITTGAAGKDGYAGTETIKLNKLSRGLYAGIIVPQRVETRRALVEIIVGNISYLMEGTMSFKPGMQHTITITLATNPSQAQIEIGGGIGGWN